MVSSNSKDMIDKAGPVLCRKRDEVERELNILLLLDYLQKYIVLKSNLDKGSVEITSDPSLEEEQVCRLGHITRVHAEYWKWLECVAMCAQRELPQQLRDEPLNIAKADRVAGARFALEWFLSGENDRLATSLNW